METIQLKLKLFSFCKYYLITSHFYKFNFLFLIDRMTANDPKERASADALCTNPFLAQACTCNELDEMIKLNKIWKDQQRQHE